MLAEKPNDLHCYSEDTEILTLTGWKTFGELTLEDRVAQFVQETKETVFVQPLEIVWQPYKGPMVHFNNKSTDMLLTPNHRVLYRSQNSKEYSIKRADEVSQFTSQLMYPTSSKWGGEYTEYTKEFYELLVAIQADGHLCKDSNAIQFSFVKQRKIDRLIDILKILDVQYSVRIYERKDRVETTIRLKAKDPTTLTLRKHLSENKKILLNMIELPYSIRYHILDCVKYWDGTVKKNGDTVIDTTDESFVDVLQSICAVTNAKCVKNSYNKKVKGFYCKVYRLYYSLDKNVAEKTIMNCSNLIDYDGMVGCVSVPSGLITVRRNGKVFISGNTINAQKLGISRDNAKALTYALNQWCM